MFSNNFWRAFIYFLLRCKCTESYSYDDILTAGIGVTSNILLTEFLRDYEGK